MSKKHKKHHKSDKVQQEDKPGLKLVLKVGTPEHGDVTPPAEEHDGEKKHKHKKKKKKHKHHRDDQERKEKRKHEKLEETTAVEVEDSVAEPPTKRQAIADVATEQIQQIQHAVPTAPASMRNLRERKNVEDEQTPLQRCLDYFHKILVRKDMNGFFAFPVTDNIAPSYSKIIQNPMDMSTMQEKLESNDYRTLDEYKADFKLMCDNCMTYNHPETIYYKEAEKMLKGGLRLMSKDKLVLLKRNMPFMTMVSDHELGIDQDPAQIGSTAGVQIMIPPKPKIKKTVMTKFEAFPDRLTPEQILAQAQDAAKDASEQLTLRKPHTKFGFLRRRDDGSTSLNLLNPENDGIVSEKERIVNIGTLVGKLQNGTGSLGGFKEDKRNKALPVNYLNYGPYSSYAPVYDSSQANLSKDDSDLLLNAYGSEAGIQYAYSICNFVADSGEYAVRMVDNLLDVITGGDHSKASKTFNEIAELQKDIPEEVKVEEKIIKTEAVTDEDVPADKEQNIDFNSIRSLADLGIDVGFVDKLEEKIKKEDDIQQKLDSSSSLLKDLQKTQYDRLGQASPNHLANVQGSDEKEQALAQTVTTKLSELVKQANPVDVVDQTALRQALGVSSSPQAQDDIEEMQPGDEFSAAHEGTTVAAADTTTVEIQMDTSDEKMPPEDATDAAECISNMLQDPVNLEPSGEGLGQDISAFDNSV